MSPLQLWCSKNPLGLIWMWHAKHAFACLFPSQVLPLSRPLLWTLVLVVSNGWDRHSTWCVTLLKATACQVQVQSCLLPGPWFLWCHTGKWRRFLRAESVSGAIESNFWFKEWLGFIVRRWPVWTRWLAKPYLVKLKRIAPIALLHLGAPRSGSRRTQRHDAGSSLAEQRRATLLLTNQLSTSKKTTKIKRNTTSVASI